MELGPVITTGNGVLTEGLTTDMREAYTRRNVSLRAELSADGCLLQME